MGVDGRATRAWALSIDSDTPRCSDQPKESSVVHAKAVVAIAILAELTSFITFFGSEIGSTFVGVPSVAASLRGALVVVLYRYIPCAEPG